MTHIYVHVAARRPT